MTRYAQKITNAGRRWVLSRPGRYATALAIVLLIATIARYGIGLYPNLNRMLDLAINWQHPVSPRWQEDFWVNSPVSAWVAGVLGLTEPRWFLIFHVVLATAALTLPFALPRLRRDPQQAQLVFLVLAAGPAGAVLFSWFGSYDPVSVIGLVLAILARADALRFLGWLVLTFNHNALGLTVIVLSLPLMLLTGRRALQRISIRPTAIALCGVLAGFTANTILMRIWGAETSRLDFFLRVGFETFVHSALRAAPLLAFSALGVGWLLLLDRRIRSWTVTRIMLGVAVVASLIIPILTLDQSRVLGLTLLGPMLLWTTLAVDHYPVKVLTGVWRTWRVPAVLVPVVLVWYQGFIVPGWTWFLGLDPVLQALAILPG